MSAGSDVDQSEEETDEDEESDVQSQEEQAEYEFDMWEGQFYLSGGGEYPCDVASCGSDRGSEVAGRPTGIDSDIHETESVVVADGREIAVEGESEDIVDGLLVDGKNGCSKTNPARTWCKGITEQVQLLQQQVSALAETQNNTDDRYSRVKQENAALTARVHMLEEQLREVELRADERLQDEQRRHRELTTRAEREKQLELENFAIRLQALDKECTTLREEATRLKQQTERLRAEKIHAEDVVSEMEVSLQSTREELRKVNDLSRREREEKDRERNGNQQIVEELSREIERLRSNEHSVTANGLQVGGMNGHIGGRARSPSLVDLPSRLGELQNEVRILRDENKNLHDANEELQAQILNRGLEEGRHLLTGTTHNSLAAEFEAMTQDELRENCSEDQIALCKIKNALKEQKEVNAELRSYIEGILLNIVENYPQLLEVKKKEK